MAAKPGDAVKTLKADIAAARKREMNFGVCMGKKPENTVLKIDRKRDGAMLAKQARKEGETVKIAFGMLQADGNKLNFICAEDAPTGLAKSLKRFMKSAGLTAYKVRLLDASGGLLEDDGDEEEAEDLTAAAPPPPGAPEAPTRDAAEAEETADEKDAEATPAAEPDETRASEAPEPEPTEAAEEPVEPDQAQEAEPEAQPEPEPAPPAREPTEMDWLPAQVKVKRLLKNMESPDPRVTQAFEKIQAMAAEGDYAGAIKGAEKLVGALQQQAAGADAALAEAHKRKWLALEPRIRAHVEEALAGEPANARKISAVWAMMQDKVAANPPDHAGAIKAMPMLVGHLKQATPTVEAATAAESEQAGAQRGAESSSPAAAAKAAQPEQEPRAAEDDVAETEMEAVAEAESEAETLVEATEGEGGDTPPPAAAPAAPAGDAAGGAAAPEPAEGEGPGEDAGGDAEGDVEFAMSPPPAKVSADLSGDDAAKLARIESELKSLDKLIDGYMAVIPGSAETRPGDWTTETSEKSGLVTTLKAPAAVLETAKLDAALKDLTKLRNEVNVKTVEKKDWSKARDLFLIGLDILDDHPQAAAPEIQPKIADIRTKLAAADAKALKQDFKGAIKALEPLAKRCAEVELIADDCAHYKAILADRQSMVAGTAGNPAVGDAKIDAMQAQCQDLLNKAATDAAADKFKEAVKKLDAIPDLHKQMRVLQAKKTEHDWRKISLDRTFSKIDPMPKAQRDLMEPELANFRKLYADSQFAKTKDYQESANQFKLLMMKEQRYFEPLSKSIRDYFPAKTAFDAQLAAFKAHPGRKGIEPFILAMEADQKQAEAEVVSKRFATAKGLLERSKPEWPTEVARADKCELYELALATYKPMLEAIRPEAAAATAVAQADALFATGAKQALARDYAAANDSLQEANLRIQDGEAAVKAAKELGALKDGAALDGIAADFAKAYKVFTDMRANVSGRDGTGTFAREIAKADTPAAAAQAAASATPPDFSEARVKLDFAIAVLERLLPAIMAWGPFQGRLAAAKNALNPGLSGVNLDDCIKPLIDAATTLVNEADTLAKAPGFDIAGAEAKLLEAQKIIDQATADAALYPAIKIDLVKINTQKALLELPVNAPILALMGDRKKKIDDFMTGIPADIAAGKIPEASRKGKEGAALLAVTTHDIAKATEALRRKKDWYDKNYDKVKDADVCKPLIASAEKKLKVYEKDLKTPNFDAAVESINPANWDLRAAERLMNAALAFEPIRIAADGSLNALRAVRNIGVEADILLLQTRYAAALALGPAGNYHRATIEMQEIVAACGPLIAKAAAFKPYEEARVPAKARLDEAAKHAKAAAVQPMIDRLTAKYAEATNKADAQDYDTAKAMMKEIEADAGKAIDSADDCETFEMVTDTLDAAADTGFLPDAVIAATEKVHARLSARPEATAARTELSGASAQLSAARAGGAGAKAALKSAIALLADADEKMSQYLMLEQSFKRALDLSGKVKGHAQAAYVLPLVIPIDAVLMATLPNAIASGNHLGEAQALEGHFTRLNELLKMADDYATYMTRRAEPGGEPILDTLEKHKHRYAIKPSIDEIRKKLNEATKAIADHKVTDALTLIEEVHKLGLSARVLADMRNNDAPSPADIKAILAQPGGDAQLDAMIDQLEPDAQRDVLRVAFEARFGCKLEMRDATGALVPDASLSGPQIKRYYELMSDLPNSDTLDNDSLLMWTENLKDNSKYRESKKQVIMNEGSEDEFNGAYGFGREFEVGGQDEACKPVDMEPVSRFSWNTLHEVGHAVDDKHGYMGKHGGSPAYGGWQEHGRDYGPVAKVFAAHFNYDQTYIEQAMLRKPNIERPEIPPGESCSEEEWERRRVAVDNHLALARKSAAPWNSNAQANQIAIGGRVYQESYDFSWNSYLVAARQQGMTGYQFRAPGEWFSELYAAYHIGKMKPEHPAATWLEKLTKP